MALMGSGSGLWWTGSAPERDHWGSVKSSMKECKEEVHHGGTKTRRRGSENLSKIGILSIFSERLRLEGEEKWGIGKSTQVVAMTSFLRASP